MYFQGKRKEIQIGKPEQYHYEAGNKFPIEAKGGSRNLADQSADRAERGEGADRPEHEEQGPAQESGATTGIHQSACVPRNCSKERQIAARGYRAHEPKQESSGENDVGKT